MADFTEDDTGIQFLGLLVPALIALIAGLVIHSFIIGVNVTDWWKGRSVTPVDHIITSLGISRMCAQCTITVYVIVRKLFLMNLHLYITLLILDAGYTFFIYTNVWLTSLLSVVLCLKISNFHTRLFLYLKGMIAHRTVYFIGTSVLLAAFTCVMPFSISITDVINGRTCNRTMDNLYIDCLYSNSIYSYIVGSIFPMIFYCISSVLLFTSLYHHTTKMKMSSNSSTNLETYYSVMKCVSFTFIYNTLYFICNFVGLYFYYIYCVYLDWLLIVLEFLPVLHSSLLIYRTINLRSQMFKVLQNVTDFLLQRKDTESKENIEVVAL
ncbi:hypothetical protein GDO78_022865 [Eleutherodactylus coqui]|uniref:Taste receptor type 2 n=1 Tax=Eleutherodactylus coqui TaxID=57060 RepID=A0A8J6JRJ7_ELECQ|nr:hypothetical protein GDO78_022865 [Eleutherodactylus coqui]